MHSFRNFRPQKSTFNHVSHGLFFHLRNSGIKKLISALMGPTVKPKLKLWTFDI